MTRENAIIALLGAIAQAGDGLEEGDGLMIKRVGLSALVELGVTRAELEKAVRDAPFFHPEEAS